MNDAAPRPERQDDTIEKMLDRHAGELRAFIRLRSGPMLRSMESTADLAQSVCREILQHRERFRHPDQDGFRRWLYIMAARKIANRVEYWRAEMRDPQRRVAVDPDEDLDGLLGCYHAFCAPSGALRTKEEVRRIESAFEQLPEHYREVIALSRIAGLSPQEVAREMGRSEASTRTLLFRALARLAQLLETRESRSD